MRILFVLTPTPKLPLNGSRIRLEVAKPAKRLRLRLTAFSLESRCLCGATLRLVSTHGRLLEEQELLASSLEDIDILSPSHSFTVSARI